MGGPTVRRFLVACPLLLVAAGVLWGAEDTKKAAETRKLLKTKVTFKWKDTPFGDVVTEMKEQVKGLRVHVDNKGGVNNNKPVTAAYKDQPLEEVLADLLGKYGWGYYVNNKKDAYDGDIFIRIGEERGYPKGEEPQEGDKPKEKPKEKPKPEDKPKVEEKPKEKPAEEDAEKVAARKLKLAKQLIEDKQIEDAKDSLETITKKYKGTKAAEEAEELLKKLKDK
jgi:hypothetical protein